MHLQLTAGSSAVVLNTTAANAAADGFVTVYPCDTPRPDASNLNFRAGQAVPNLVISRIAADGTVCLYTSAAADLVADVAGWFPVNEPYVAITPVRVLDGRHCNVAVYGSALDGHIYSDDYDTGYTNDLGPRFAGPGDPSVVMRLAMLAADCWLYILVSKHANGHDEELLYRVAPKALDPTFELVPGQNFDLDRPGARLIGSSSDGRYLWLNRWREPGPLVRVDTATREVVPIMTDVPNLNARSVTPDGRFVLTQASPVVDTVRIYDRVTRTSRDVAVVPNMLHEFQLAPNGSSFADQTTPKPISKPHTVTVYSSIDGHVMFQHAGKLAGWSIDGALLFVDEDVMYKWDGQNTTPYLDVTDVDIYTEGPIVFWPRPSLL